MESYKEFSDVFHSLSCQTGECNSKTDNYVASMACPLNKIKLYLTGEIKA